jgi:hypothetical protein
MCTKDLQIVTWVSSLICTATASYGLTDSGKLSMNWNISWSAAMTVEERVCLNKLDDKVRIDGTSTPTHQLLLYTLQNHAKLHLCWPVSGQFMGLSFYSAASVEPNPVVGCGKGREAILQGCPCHVRPQARIKTMRVFDALWGYIARKANSSLFETFRINRIATRSFQQRAQADDLPPGCFLRRAMLTESLSKMRLSLLVTVDVLRLN